MTEFFLGALEGAFIMLNFVQFATQKSINFSGYVDKSKDPKGFWIFILTYFAGFLGVLAFMIFL